jgi:hypothetical protein
MAGEITITEYRYEEIYPSFKAATDEKHITARINAAFLRGLIRRGLIGASGRPLIVADIGCGPCDTILMYLVDAQYAPGYRIRATDFSSEYADPARGKAVLSLADAQRNKQVPIVDFSVAQGDAFAGNLLQLVSDAGDADARNSFDLVFASHMLYHCDGLESLRVMVNDVVTNLLKDDGIFLLYHAVAPPGTFIYLRSKFGRHGATLEHSDTPAPNIGDPAMCVAEYCADQGLPCLELNFGSRMHMRGLTEAHWQTFRDPQHYARLVRDDPAAAENLKRLMFITQRAPLEFAADRSPLGLDAYLAEARSIIEANGGEMPLAERLQVVCRPGLPDAFMDGLRAALDEAGSRS